MKHLIILLSLLFLSCSPKPVSILIIGDSISSDVIGGYPGYIRELKPEWKVDVLAYPGKSSGDISSAVGSSNIDYSKYSHLLVMIGMNDYCAAEWIEDQMREILLHWKNKEHLKKYLLMYPIGSWCRKDFFKQYDNIMIAILKIMDWNPIRYDGNGYRGKVSWWIPGSQRVNYIKTKIDQDNFWEDGLHIKPAGNLEIAKQIVERIEQEK